MLLIIINNIMWTLFCLLYCIIIIIIIITGTLCNLFFVYVEIVASETNETEGGNAAKLEDFKSTVSHKVLVSDTKPVGDAEEPATDMKPVRGAVQPVIPHLKTELGNDGLLYEALPLQDPAARRLECPHRSWSMGGSSVGRGQRTPEAQSSIIDLSLDKELDLSRKTKVVDLSEALVDAIPLKKKVFRNCSEFF